VRAASLLCLVAVAASAQPAPRRLTTIDALRRFPGYYHLQNVLLRGEFAEQEGRVMLRSDDDEIRVLLNDTHTPDGPAEVRGQLIDVGRLEPGDPRVAKLARRDEDRWPKPGEELILNVSGAAPAQAASTPSIRALALEPWKFEGQKVTVVGQFRGRNLFGDLPGSPAKSKYDFVLRAADASLWVSGLRPRGKGFELNVDARVDTGRWVEVTGVVSRNRGLVTLDATAIATATEPTLATEPEEPAAPVLPPDPVEVVFSSPSEGETDVAIASPVRIQFSRSIDPATLKDHLRVSYLGAESFERGEAQPPGVEVVPSYDPGMRALELKFPKPLERFRTVKVELLEGIKAFDGGPVMPWTLTFSVGG
jgi:hypothetical protein